MKHTHVILIFFFPLFFACNQPQNPLTTFAGKNDTTLLAETFGICTDTEGILYAADVRNHCISKINELGEVTVYAGTKEEGDNDGVLNEASFISPSGVCFDKDRNMYVAGFGGNNIRKITPDGMVSTLAGTGEEGYVNGLADSAKFSSPRGVCADSKGNVFVADCWNHRIRKISPDGMVTTFAGGGKIGVLVENAWRDGADTAARFDAPCGLSIDKNDNIYVADANNSCIRKINPDGYVTTLAGIGKQKGLLDGSKDTALLNVPTELFVAEDLTVYFSDTYNHCVRKVDADGIVTTLAGTGEEGFTEAEPLNSLLSSPRGICVYNDYLYFAEWGNHTIRKLKLE